MRHKRCGVLILATALLIIGMRGVCMAHYSEHLSIDKSDTQKLNEVQVAISIDKSIQTKFVFRVKRYFYVPPQQYVTCEAVILMILDSHRLTRSLSLPVLTVSKNDLGLLRQRWSSTNSRP